MKANVFHSVSVSPDLLIPFWLHFLKVQKQ